MRAHRTIMCVHCVHWFTHTNHFLKSTLVFIFSTTRKKEEENATHLTLGLELKRKKKFKCSKN